ncbi:MAG: hypothetical protein ACON3Z_19220 [Bradymonadia bacterium]
MYTFSIQRLALILGNAGYFRPSRRPKIVHRLVCVLLVTAGALLVGCDESTPRPMLSLDSSFVGLDGPTVVDDARTQFDDGSQSHAQVDASELDAKTAPSDAATASDVGVLTDQSPAGDAAAQDAAVTNDVEAPMPPGACGELPFVNLNEHALDSEPGFQLSGTVRGNRFRLSCSADGTAGADRVHRLTVPSAGTWVLETSGSQIDTVLAVRTECERAVTELACSNDASEALAVRHSALSLDLVAGEHIFVIVDTYHGLSAGEYTLTVRPLESADDPAITRADALQMGESAFDLAFGLANAYSSPIWAEVEVIGEGNRAVQSVHRVEGPVFVDSGVQQGVVSLSDVRFTRMPEETIRVRVMDTLGRWSSWRDIVWLDASPPGIMGSICGGLGFGCDDGLVCAAAQCTDARELRNCPAHWPTRTIEVDEFGHALVRADNSMADGLRAGSCGGGTATQMFELSVPRSGLYQFTVTPLDGVGSPILFLREFCDFDEAMHQRELACGIDVDPEWFLEPPVVGASLRAQLDADHTYFVAVDSLGRNGQPNWSGPYALEMVPVNQPQIDQARIVFDGERNLIGVYLSGRDRNPSTAAIRLAAANGSVLPFSDEETLWPVDIHTRHQDDEQFFLYGLIDVTGRVSARAARSVEAFVYDTTRLTSVGHLVEFSEPALLQADEACDPMAIVSRCTAPQVCVNEAPPRCDTPQP